MTALGTSLPRSALECNGTSGELLVLVLSFLGVDMIDCMAVQGTPFYPEALGWIHWGCLFSCFSLLGWVVRVHWFDRQVQSVLARSCCVISGQALPPKGKSGIWVWTLFSESESCLFQHTTSFSKVLLFLLGCDWAALPHTDWINSVLSLTPKSQRQNFPSLY
jgi:hypothetical protein